LKNGFLVEVVLWVEGGSCTFWAGGGGLGGPLFFFSFSESHLGWSSWTFRVGGGLGGGDGGLLGGMLSGGGTGGGAWGGVLSLGGGWVDKWVLGRVLGGEEICWFVWWFFPSWGVWCGMIRCGGGGGGGGGGHWNVLFVGFLC